MWYFLVLICSCQIILPGNSSGATIYSNLSDCQKAGEIAKENRSSRMNWATVEYTCVPTANTIGD